MKKGAHHSSETIEKMLRTGMSKFERTDEYRAKLSSVQMGHIVTQETRDKISKGHKNKKVDKNVRQKISISKGGTGIRSDSLWLKQYGITQANYFEMVKSQNNVCKICGGVNKSGRRLSVDHNHETGRVRGLLCHRCNLAIGLFGDDVNNLARAIQYIECSL